MAPDRRTVLNKSPTGSVCLECVHAVLDSTAPSKTTWEAFEVLLDDPVQGPQQRTKLLGTKARLSGKKTQYEKQSVALQTHIGMTFVETYDPVTAEEMGAKYPGRDCGKAPGLQWHRVPIGRGVMAEVVLMRDATAKPRFGGLPLG